MKVDFVYFSDWTAMYVDGKLAYQNTRIDGYTALQVLRDHMDVFSLESHTPTGPFEDLVEDWGAAPSKLEECDLMD